LSAEAVRKAVADSVPSNFRELNLKAFEKGHEYGLKSLIGNQHTQVLEHMTYAEE
jgi:Pyruvate/2-oxoacid:ferredoxin oxidoreductase gamma subunit